MARARVLFLVFCPIIYVAGFVVTVVPLCLWVGSMMPTWLALIAGVAIGWAYSIGAMVLFVRFYEGKVEQ